MRLVDVVVDVVAECDATSAQVALAWLASCGEDVVLIPGTGTLRHLEGNVASLDVGLTAYQLTVTRRPVAPCQAVAMGDR